LGLDASIIYVDVEQYDLAAGCSAAVRAYISGWTQQIHTSARFAGVYGNTVNAATDWVAAQPLPDQVWLSRGDNTVTVWNLDHGLTNGLTDAPWPSHQRSHQYQINKPQVWGGLTETVDSDIEDGVIAAGNGHKSYSFTPFQLLYSPQANGCFGCFYFNGINNGINGPANGGVQLGKIVGFYSHYDGPGYTWHGLIYYQGAFSTFDFPGSGSQSGLLGINNLGDMIGFYQTLDSHQNVLQHMYISKGGGTPVATDYPGAVQTYAGTINDAGWISGEYVLPDTTTHFFLYKSNQGRWISYDEPPTDAAEGINGLGVIAGYGNQDPTCGWGKVALTDDAEDGQPGLTSYITTFPVPAGHTCTYFSGINNNGQMTGSNADITNGIKYPIIFHYNKGFTDYSNSSIGWSEGAYINDDSQIVGESLNNANGNVYGLVLVPPR
jgi:Domain of unknown function (DUF1906)